MSELTTKLPTDIMSYYTGENADTIPWGTAVVNLDIISTTNFSNRKK